MNIIALSRADADKAIPPTDCYMISITEPNEDPPFLHSNWKDILYLKFDDIDKVEKPLGTRELELFSLQQAKQIIDFVETYKDNINILAVHCAAGISRSVGVHVALEKIYNTKDLYSRYPCHNKHVAQTIIACKAAMDGNNE